MPQATYANLQDENGRSALRFERTLPYPAERVWQALTTHDELSAWHPTPFELERVAGGQIRFLATAGGPEMPPGRVLAYDPPHRLAYTWGDDELRFELRRHDGCCLLRLTHVFGDRLKAARDAAGWHLCLDALSSSLAGAPGARRGTQPRLPGGWSELNDEYQQRFGISAEEATPPPARG